MVGMRAIIGQDRVVAALQNSLESGRTSHAWVFQGPFGVGKCTTAIEFARRLLSPESEVVSLKHDENGLFSHPDLHIIRKEDSAWSKNVLLARRKQTNIPVDLLRERMIGGRTSDDRDHDSPAFKTSIAGGNKVFIIDEAELLDETAQNAILKTLEEPPAGTFIILVTSRDDLLLQTVQSRCQGAVFSELSEHDMDKWANLAGLDVLDSDVAWSVQFSQGSPGLVCLSLENNLPQLAKDLEGFIRSVGSELLDSVAAQTMIEFVDSFVKQSLEKNSYSSKEAANRRAFSIILQLFGTEVRRLVGGNNHNPSLGIRAAAVLSDIESQVRTNISMKVLLESLAVRWTCLCSGSATFMPL